LGHDFRAYTNLGYLKIFPSTPILALTATADKATRKNISQQLNLKIRNYLSLLLIEKFKFRGASCFDRVKQIIDFIQENQMNQELFIVSAENNGRTC
jgi:ATP-dependent DNA helicase RecQ